MEGNLYSIQRAVHDFNFSRFFDYLQEKDDGV